MIQISAKAFKFIVGGFFILLGYSMQSSLRSVSTIEIEKLGIPAPLLGVLLLIAGVVILYVEKGNIFILLTLPFFVYAVGGFMVFINTGVLQPVIIITFLTALITYIGLKWR